MKKNDEAAQVNFDSPVELHIKIQSHAKALTACTSMEICLRKSKCILQDFIVLTFFASVFTTAVYNPVIFCSVLNKIIPPTIHSSYMVSSLTQSV